MRSDFYSNELVTVVLDPQLDPNAQGNLQSYQYQFMVGAPVPANLPTALFSAQLPATTATPARAQALASGPILKPTGGKPLVAATPAIMPNGVSVPSDFPKVIITANTNPSPGYLFLENGIDIPPYTMILDNQGLPVWYRRGRMYDFKIQKNGQITWCLSDDTGFPAFDQNFNYIKTYLTTNGYLTDGHELKVMPDGIYYMLGYQLNEVDLSQYILGGNPQSVVRETVVQQFTPEGDLIFQWRAWDNYQLSELGGNTDFPHMNGLDIDDDGNILVSARHLSEVTKINRDSGDIMWRLSGFHSSFRFINDPFDGTSFQHNISAVGQGRYMVFDNGDGHSPEVSRVAEYQLDLANMTATLVWSFRDNPDKYAYYMGSAQRLPTGNTLINFVMASYPKVIEVDTNGVKRFELSLVPSSDSYRAFRLPWNGNVAAPYLIAQPQPDNVTLIFNKFGDTNVSYYRIYGGFSPHPTNVLGESSATLKSVYNLQNGLHYFRVTAINTDGSESPFSNEESVNVNITSPGQNMVQNGDFLLGSASWYLSFDHTAGALWSFDARDTHITVTNGGTSPSSVQLAQLGKALIQGYKYVLDFDAWSSQTRYIDVRLTQALYPFINYSQFTSALTPTGSHYRYTFVMQQPSDFSATLLFNLGASTADVYLANISLFNPPTGDLNLDGRVDFLDLGIFGSSWLKQQFGLPSDLDGNGRVDFNDFNLLGGSWGAAGP
jgi:hypothetical protein